MLGTNLLLYYDAWQNRFLVCIMISVLEFFSTNMVLGLLVLDLACWKCGVAATATGGAMMMNPCFAPINFLILMLGCASWATHEFANDRLDVAAKAWDEKFEEGVLKVQCALAVWFQKSF